MLTSHTASTAHMVVQFRISHMSMVVVVVVEVMVVVVVVVMVVVVVRVRVVGLVGVESNFSVHLRSKP